MSRNAISGNPEHYIFKSFQGSMPPDPPRRPKKIFLAAAWLKNFFQDRLPPKQKILDRTLYMGMCHRPGSIFHFQKSRPGLKFWNRPWFLKFCSTTGSFFDNLVSNPGFQMSKIAVAFLTNDRYKLNFLFKKYACLLAKDTERVHVTIIISKLHSNKLMLPVGALVSCSLMLTYFCKKE